MFIRSKAEPQGKEIPIGRLRGMLVALYISYPVGCLLRLFASEQTGVGFALDIGGLLLIGVAAMMFIGVAGASAQRLMQEEERLLDERERAERRKAHQSAYMILASFFALAVIYMQLALDLANRSQPVMVWTPTTGDHWNALFWYVFFLAMTLPTAVHAFSRQSDLGDDE